MLDPPPQLPLEIHSASMRRTVEALFAAARTDAPIVLRAELGTEVSELARLAHQESPRRGHRFVTLACASLDQLPVRTLATTAGGTIFLHEVGELATPLQSKLVHLLDAVASRGPPPRLISSNRRDLDDEVAGGRLESELCFRLNVVDIPVPPLRERSEDILPAARGIILSLSTDLGRRAPDALRGSGGPAASVSVPWKHAGASQHRRARPLGLSWRSPGTPTRSTRSRRCTGLAACAWGKTSSFAIWRPSTSRA